MAPGKSIFLRRAEMPMRNPALAVLACCGMLKTKDETAYRHRLHVCEEKSAFCVDAQVFVYEKTALVYGLT